MDDGSPKKAHAQALDVARSTELSTHYTYAALLSPPSHTGPTTRPPLLSHNRLPVARTNYKWSPSARGCGCSARLVVGLVLAAPLHVDEPPKRLRDFAFEPAILYHVPMKTLGDVAVIRVVELRWQEV